MNHTSHSGILIAIGVTVTGGIIGVVLRPESAVIILGFCGMICTQLFTRLSNDKKLDAVAGKAEEVAVKAGVVAQNVEEVRTKLDENVHETAGSLKRIENTGDLVHTLVNGAMSVQLQIGAVALRRVADLTNDPGDVAAAELAETALVEHQSKQKL